MNTASESYVIRPPRPSEKRACRVLLPQPDAAGQETCFTVAVSGNPERVIGAAALTWDTTMQGLRGWEVDVHVIPPYRRQAIASAMIERVCSDASARSIEKIHTKPWVEPVGDAANFWMSLGFTPVLQKFEFTGASVDALAALKPLYEQICARQKIPSDAQVITLAEADLDAVIRLHTQHLGGTANLLLPLLNGTHPNSYDSKLSFVLLLHGEIVGFILGRILPNTHTYQLEATVLAPGVRRSWGNVWLRYVIALKGIAAGVDTLRFFALDHHSDTHRASVRLNCELTQTLVRMGRSTYFTSTSIGN